jgi:hypothetical protein
MVRAQRSGAKLRRTIDRESDWTVSALQNGPDLEAAQRRQLERHVGPLLGVGQLRPITHRNHLPVTRNPRNGRRVGKPSRARNSGILAPRASGSRRLICLSRSTWRTAWRVVPI